MTIVELINQPLPGFGPADDTTDVEALDVEPQERPGVPLVEFGVLHARAVHDHWQADPSYPLHSHLFDYLIRCGFSFVVESTTDREIYNGLFDWIESLGTVER